MNVICKVAIRDTVFLGDNNLEYNNGESPYRTLELGFPLDYFSESLIKEQNYQESLAKSIEQFNKDIYRKGEIDPNEEHAYQKLANFLGKKVAIVLIDKSNEENNTILHVGNYNILQYSNLANLLNAIISNGFREIKRPFVKREN